MNNVAYTHTDDNSRSPGYLVVSYDMWYTSREISYTQFLIPPLHLWAHSSHLPSGLDRIIVIVTHMNFLSSCICEELVFSSCFVIINKLFLTIILKTDVFKCFKILSLIQEDNFVSLLEVFFPPLLFSFLIFSFKNQ